jgi:hypothetical protein
LATFYASQRNFVQAEPHFKRSLRILEQTLGLEHPNTIKVMKNYAIMLRMAKHNTRAEELEKRIKSIEAKLAQEHSTTTE